MREIELGKQRAQKIRRAANVSKIDGGIMAFFAVGALASILFQSWSGFILGCALAVVSFNSFRGAKRLEQLDRTAPAFLAINQFFLAGSIIIYALYSLREGLAGQSDLVKQLGGGGPGDGGAAQIEQLYQLIVWVLYGGLMIGTIVAQGLAALYYASRAKYVRAYLDQTPQWVVDLQKAHAS
jgi:hypothetical protein